MTTTARTAYPVPQAPTNIPLLTTGEPVEPVPYFHDWDQTPHAIFSAVPVQNIQLGDVLLGGTHQVEGIGRSDQRGRPAIRFDVNFVVTQSDEPSARIVLPLDHQVEVKRYFPNPGHRFAWLKLEGYPAGLAPDYGDRVSYCCGRDQNTVNPHGYEPTATICDACVDSWEIDYDVVRHVDR